MRGLRKYLTPFAPDQSGAVSVLYEFGGIIVICDAGGCTGNICGFDEPRWFESKSALFSAGLRDMDAILGRDDRLVAKLADAVTKLDAKFAAIIGTPVPSTASFVTVQLLIVLSDGIVNIRSIIVSSIMERSPLAPVFLEMVFSAIAFTASSSNFRSTPSSSNSF